MVLDKQGDWRGRAGVEALVDRIEVWARAHDGILGMAEFGSNARADRPGDEWSDVDVLLLVHDASPWRADLDWIDVIGPTWARFLHPSPIPGTPVHQALFAGGYDADLVVVDAATLRGVLEVPEAASAVFGHGVRIVFDQDGSLDVLRSIAEAGDVVPPNSQAFADLVGQLRFQAVWATKRWRRGELWRVVDDLDSYMARRLLTLIEWAAIGEGRSDVYPDGRRLERWASPEEVERIRLSRSTYDAAEAARAIVALHDESESVASRVAAIHGFTLEPADALRRWLVARLAGG